MSEIKFLRNQEYLFEAENPNAKRITEASKKALEEKRELQYKILRNLYKPR